MRFFTIALFGVAGVFARYVVGLAAGKFLPTPFPYGTLLINVVGSFLIGIVFVLGAERTTISPELRLGLIVGFLGGFTTFSSYSLDTWMLVEQNRIAYAASYFILSPMLGLLAVFGGVYLARACVS